MESINATKKIKQKPPPSQKRIWRGMRGQWFWSYEGSNIEGEKKKKKKKITDLN